MLNPMYFGVYNNYLKGFYYTIQKNDTIEAISKRYRVSANQIIMINKITYPYILVEGRKIFIPGIDEPIASDGGSIYTVKFGDNLVKISKRFNIDINEIKEKNFLNNDSIYIGQKILIPSCSRKSETAISEHNSDIANDKQADKNEIKIYPIGEVSKQSNRYNNSFTSKFSALRRGDNDKNVVTLKRLVSTLGYNIRNFNAYFDSSLEQQIKKIQKEAQFEENGYVDNKVWDYIFNSINKMPSMN